MIKKDIKFGKKKLLEESDFDPKYIKERITIMLDQDILDKARQIAKEKKVGYQTFLNDTLRKALVDDNENLLVLEEWRKSVQDQIDLLSSKIKKIEKKRA